MVRNSETLAPPCLLCELGLTQPFVTTARRTCSADVGSDGEALIPVAKGFVSFVPRLARLILNDLFCFSAPATVLRAWARFYEFVEADSL